MNLNPFSHRLTVENNFFAQRMRPPFQRRVFTCKHNAVYA